MRMMMCRRRIWAAVAMEEVMVVVGTEEVKLVHMKERLGGGALDDGANELVMARAAQYGDS